MSSFFGLPIYNLQYLIQFLYQHIYVISIPDKKILVTYYYFIFIYQFFPVVFYMLEYISGLINWVESQMELNIINILVTYRLESYYWSDSELLFLIPNLESGFQPTYNKYNLTIWLLWCSNLRLCNNLSLTSPNQIYRSDYIHTQNPISSSMEWPFHAVLKVVSSSSVTGTIPSSKQHMYKVLIIKYVKFGWPVPHHESFDWCQQVRRRW